RMLGPGSLRRGRCIDVGLREIDTAAPIENLIALPIVQKRGPTSLDVRPSAIQIVSRRKVQDRHGVAYIVPMNQIVRPQDPCSRRIVHIGGGVVIRVPNSKNVAIREIFPEHGILKLSALWNAGL